MISLSELHDSTLKTLSFDLDSAEVRLSLVTGLAGFADVVIAVKNVMNLKVPRFQPWGPSSSVNLITITGVIGNQLLSVELQSGDLLEINCGSVALENSLGEAL